ncbi:hypothetical protein WJX81_005965 [Elliptochloris bilobata]|uniref:mRNA export factor GLE1 n=1 Tax=Elliptochloris bilobata TaxID=381761 RepID=A0AAW1QNC0_9CHLO
MSIDHASYACRAPSGLDGSDSGSDSGAEASFSIIAPRAYSGGESSEEEEVQSAAPRGVRTPTPPQRAAAELACFARHRLHEAAQLAVSRFDAALLEVDAEEADKLARLDDWMHDKKVRDAERSAQRAEAVAGDRAALADRLDQLHRQKAQVLGAKAEAAAAKAAAAAAAAAAEERAAAEAREAEARRHAEEQAQQAEEGRRAHEEQQAAQAAAAAAAAAQASAQQATSAAAAPQEGGGNNAAASSGRAVVVRVASAAAEAEKRCWAAMATAQDAVKGFLAAEAQKRERRQLDKFVKLNVQQISGTQRQVSSKAQALVQFLGGLAGEQRAYACLQLAATLVSQAEAQVALRHAFAFPLAMVAAAVAAAHADFAPLLLARLYHACPLAVPRYLSLRKGADRAHFFGGMAYRDKAEAGDGAGGPAWESTDEYVGRMQGYIAFYAAFLQAEQPGHPHGLEHAWTFCARLLNHLPANRSTATALDAFLKAAGYRMAAAYGRQFMKLLQVLDSAFMADLSRQADPDAKAVHSRLATYLRSAAWRQEPEGRALPQSDSSSYDRA